MKVQKKINHFRPLSRDPEWDTLKASQDPLFIVSRRLPDPTCLVCSGKRAFLALSWEDEHSQSCSPHPKCHIQAAPRVGRGPTPLGTPCATITILSMLLSGAWRSEMSSALRGSMCATVLGAQCCEPGRSRRVLGSRGALSCCSSLSSVSIQAPFPCSPG